MMGRLVVFAILAGVAAAVFAITFKPLQAIVARIRWWFRAKQAERNLRKSLDRKLKADAAQAEVEAAAMASAVYASSTQTVTSKKTQQVVERMVQRTSQRVLESKLTAIDDVVRKYKETQARIQNDTDLSPEQKARLFQEMESLAEFPELRDIFAEQRKAEREQQRREQTEAEVREAAAQVATKEQPTRSKFVLENRWEPVIRAEECYEVLTENGESLVPTRLFDSPPTIAQLSAELGADIFSDQITTKPGAVARLESLTDATPWRAFHQKHEAVWYLLRLAIVKIPDPELHERLEAEFRKAAPQERAEDITVPKDT